MMSGSDRLGAGSRFMLLAVVPEPLREIVEGCEEKAGRGGVVTEGAGLLGWTTVLATGARGTGAGATVRVVGAKREALPPPPLWTCGRFPEAEVVPVEGENCGRKTESVRLSGSSCSRRPPLGAGALTGLMVTLWTSLRVAVAMREGGIPWLMTRWLPWKMDVEGDVPR